MSVVRHVTDEVISTEYRVVTDELFTAISDGSDGESVARAASQFAASLGIGADFSDVFFAAERPRADHRLLGHFRNNVELLIQKTWIEKADEAHKEKLLDRIPSFVSDMERADYERGLKTFIHILDELAYLLFGAQSRKGDFIEYASRVDPQFGLFWWYAGKLSTLLGQTESDKVRPVLLIGVCFLASF